MHANERPSTTTTNALPATGAPGHRGRGRGRAGTGAVDEQPMADPTRCGNAPAPPTRSAGTHPPRATRPRCGYAPSCSARSSTANAPQAHPNNVSPSSCLPAPATATHRSPKPKGTNQCPHGPTTSSRQPRRRPRRARGFRAPDILVRPQPAQRRLAPKTLRDSPGHLPIMKFSCASDSQTAIGTPVITAMPACRAPR